jgi:hypothetical protein
MKSLQKIIYVVLLAALVGIGGLDKISAATNEVSTAQSQPQTITVHITKTGKKYHMAGCRYLSKSDIPIDLKTAKAQGYTPCSVCNPPK